MEKTVVALGFALVCCIYQAAKLDEVRKENFELRKSNLKLELEINSLNKRREEK